MSSESRAQDALWQAIKNKPASSETILKKSGTNGRKLKVFLATL